MKNTVLLAIAPKIAPLSRNLGASGKSGVLGRKSGVSVSKLSGSTALAISILFRLESHLFDEIFNSKWHQVN